MRLIKPSFKIWGHENTLEGIYKQIERAGRVCYKSEDKITETSAKEFVERMVKSGHGAMLEHGTVYLKVPYNYYKEQYEVSELEEFYGANPYSKINEPLNMDYGYPAQGEYQAYYITTNYRVLVENDRLDDLQYLYEPTEYHDRRVTVKFICDRGVSHEFVRHRVFSFAQESTRYCNYSRDKFDGEITYILPPWFTDFPECYIRKSIDGSFEPSDYYRENLDGSFKGNVTLMTNSKYWVDSLFMSEKSYLSLIKTGWSPQQARAVLPNSLKTELVMTGFASDWEHFFKLRDAGSAHPQARELAHPLHMEFLRRGYITDLYDEANPD